MRKKLRTLYLNEDLEYRLQQLAEYEDSSISRIVRIALERYLKSENNKADYIKCKNNK